MLRGPPRSTLDRSSAPSDVYKGQRWPGFPAERPRRRRGVRGRPMPTLSTRPSSRSVASPTVASHASGSDTSATITLAVPPSSWMKAALSSAERRFMSAQATGAGSVCARGHVDRHRGSPSTPASRAIRSEFSVKPTRWYWPTTMHTSISCCSSYPVSYTHLTPPTSALVEISVGAVSLKKKK